MRAKADLVPDCDVHGETMSREECSAVSLGLPGSRDVIVWRCRHDGCGRYFEGGVGYRNISAAEVTPGPRCARDRAFLVVQRALSRSICPVAGCTNEQPWDGSGPLETEVRSAELVARG